MAFFIVFLGMDGSGKSSVAAECAKRLENAILVSSSEVRSGRPTLAVGDRVSLFQHFKFYSENVSYISDKVKESGMTIISDRYWYDTLVYHEALGLEGIGAEDFVSLAKPDVIIFLKVTEEVRRERMINRGASPEDLAVNDLSVVIQARLIELVASVGSPCHFIDTSALSLSQVVDKVLDLL